MSEPERVRLFRPDIEGVFLKRPNRFIIEAVAGNSVLQAHCPNPGRMEELLLPGTRFIFEHNNKSSRRTSWSLAAVRYRDNFIPLNSGRANLAASELILPLFFPGAAVIPEVSEGPSRFDFLVRRGQINTLVEVKACTLVEHGTAMFPDAPTERGRRHIEHLVELSGKPNTRAMIIFVIMNPEAERFVPNIHTDASFSISLERSARNIDIRAVSIFTDGEGYARIKNPDIPVDFTPLAAAVRDSGVYLLLLHIRDTQHIRTGSLGELSFPPGWYVYAGSAKKNLSARTARHVRKNKKIHWHIDYLAAAADIKKVYPVYTELDLECRLAGDLSRICEHSVPGFGCSDCSCPSHLFYFRNNPIPTALFQELILKYRHRDGIMSLSP